MIDTRGNDFGAEFRSPKRAVETRYSLVAPRHFALPKRERDATGRRGENSPGVAGGLRTQRPFPLPHSNANTVKNMKIQFRIRGLNANAGLRAWLEKQLERLHNLIPVSTAEVVLERERDSAPAFRAHVHLAVPGPDIHAAARDHTLEAVWLKVAKNLHKQIERRKSRQQLRFKSHRQHPQTASRWSSSPLAARV